MIQEGHNKVNLVTNIGRECWKNVRNCQKRSYMLEKLPKLSGKYGEFSVSAIKSYKYFVFRT